MSICGMDFKKEIKKIKNRKLIVCDANVYRLYEKELHSLDAFTLVLNAGENAKSINSIMEIYDKLLELEFSREDYLIALGGGVIGDLVGFAASSFKRGMKLIQVPTTLLAFVDSSVGGKTGFNYAGIKNLIGSFKEAEQLILDLSFIKTLPEREILNGVGELIKYSFLSEEIDRDYIIDNISAIYDKDENILSDLIEKALNIKLNFIKNDIEDRGDRRKLNLGHTIGHAIESLSKFKEISHGEAVMLGIVFEAKISEKMGLLSNSEFCQIKKTIFTLVRIPSYTKKEADDLLKYIMNDKKNTYSITMALPVSNNRVEIVDEIAIEIIKEVLEDEFRI